MWKMVFLFSIFFISSSLACFEGDEVDLILSLIRHMQAFHCVLVSETCTSVSSLSAVFKLTSKLNVFTEFKTMIGLEMNLKKGSYPNANAVIIVKIEESNALKDFNYKGLRKKMDPFFKWVVLSDSAIFKDLDGSEIYIPYNCFFLLVQPSSSDFFISQIYQMAENSSFIDIRYGIWLTNNKKLRIRKQKFFLGERTDLRGTQLVVGRSAIATCLLPAVCLHNEMLLALFSVLNITILNVTYTDMERLNVKADINISVDQMHADNSYKNALGPTMSVKVYMFLQFDGKPIENVWPVFFRPFAGKTWLATFIFIVVATHCMLLQYFFKSGKNIMTIYDFIFLPLQLFSNQAKQILPRNISFLISFFATIFASAVIVPSYSGSIISTLVVGSPRFPFNNIKELSQDRSYQLSTFSNSFNEGYFKKSTDPVISEIGRNQFVQDDELVETYQQGIENICSNPKLIFLGFNTNIYGLPSPCRIGQIPTPVFSCAIGIPIAEGSPFKPLLNRLIVRFRTSGITQRLDGILSTEKPEKEKLVFRPIEIRHVTTILLFLYSGVFVSYFIMILEIQYKKRDLVRRLHNNRLRVLCLKHALKASARPLKQSYVIKAFGDKTLTH